MKRLIDMTVVMLLLLSTWGCQSYERQPLNLAEFAQGWSVRELDSEAVKSYLAQLSGQTGGEGGLDVGDGVSLAEAKAVTLWLNTDLRVSRLQVEGSARSASLSDLWDDPEVNLDVLRFVDSMPDPWLSAVGVHFTIPISGRLDATKHAAWARHAARLHELEAEERDTVVALEERWVTWSAIQSQLELHATHITSVGEIRNIADRLVAAGELTPSDGRVVRLEEEAADAEMHRLKSEARSARLRVLETMGLAPDAQIELVPSVAVVTPDESADLVSHPRIQAAKARYEEAEQNLRLEIARQYPDLKLGPIYEDEEGQGRVGLGLSVPIPVFNRNRRFIAEAATARDVARAAAIAAFQDLNHAYVQATTQLTGMRAYRQELADGLAPVVAEQLDEIKRLAELGELDILLLADALSRWLEAKSSLLAAQRDEAIAAARVVSMQSRLRVLPVTEGIERLSDEFQSRVGVTP